MGTCVTKNNKNIDNYNKAIDEYNNEIIELCEDDDKITILPIIKMNDIKHNLMMNKLVLRQKNINKIYIEELQKNKL